MATRFHFADATAPAVSPALQSYTHAAPAQLRSALEITTTDALSTDAYAPDAADHLVAGDSLMRQFVSVPMDSGNVFTTSDAWKAAIQCLESNAGNNLQLQYWIGVYSEDGSTLQATLRSKVLEGLEMGTALTNRFLSSTLSGGYTTVAGDRLVVEVSALGTPTGAGGVQGHNASIRVGGNGAGGDLPENDTDTGTTLNGWIEFVTTISFPVAVDQFVHYPDRSIYP